MKILVASLFSLLCASCSAQTPAPKPVPTQAASNVPTSVNRIEAYRINGMLVRVIKHNMEIEAKIDFELLTTPDLTLLDSLSISQITLDGEQLDFAGSDGVFVEDIREQGSGVLVVFDYFYSGGGSDLIACYLGVEKSLFGGFSCNRN